MGRRADPDRELSAAEREAAGKIVVFLVRWKRIDPSLDGDGTDQRWVALCRTLEEAESCAADLQRAERDGWSSYGVRGPIPLPALATTEGFARAGHNALVRSVLAGKPGLLLL